MSRLYPTLEDMRVDQLQTAQNNHERAIAGSASSPVQFSPTDQEAPPPYSAHSGSALYPSLSDYMGLQFTPEMMQELQVIPSQVMQVGIRQTQSGQTQIAPITGNSLGLARAEIKSGVREVVLCKNQDGKLGLRIRHVNNGLFVAFVQAGYPAALAGLRFGDQILQINGKTVAGWDSNKAHNYLKKVDDEKIELILRDRPFGRTVTMQKDSNGFVGFVFDNGRIKSLVKDSSAARNGLLIDHQMIEIDGQNVVGLKDKEIGEIIDSCGRTVTVTVMPCVIYNHIVKWPVYLGHFCRMCSGLISARPQWHSMGNSIIKKLMDHSIPDL